MLANLVSIKLEKLILITAIIVLCIDLSYSIKQYQNTKLDGDFANIVLPNQWYAKVLNNPFGKAALIDGERYQASNRFTAHFLMRSYFYNVPLYLQRFFTPIDSLYVSVTIAKFLIHLLYIFLIGYYVALLLKYSIFKHIIAMAIISPFLINFGMYQYYLGFNDKSITYSMFYTLPIILLLLYYLVPLKKLYVKNEKLSIFLLIIYLPITLFIVLSGPIVAPFMLILNTILIIYELYKVYTIKILTINNQIIFFSIGIIFSLYSIYLGTYNVENDGCNLSIVERYSKLFQGLHNLLFTIKEGLLFIYVLIIVNFLLLYKFKISSKLNKVLIVLFSVSLLYIFLIPLGGCREYRPFIIRRDTFLPIFTIILFLMSVTSLHLLFNKRYWFLILWLPFSIVFWKSDIMPLDYESNVLEKKNLVQVSESVDSCVTLNENFSVLSWRNSFDCNESYINSQLLLHYRITPKLTLYKNR